MKHLSFAEISVIKARIQRGDKYHDIASDYRINQGRISDLKFGRIFPEIAPAKLGRDYGIALRHPHQTGPNA